MDDQTIELENALNESMHKDCGFHEHEHETLCIISLDKKQREQSNNGNDTTVQCRNKHTQKKKLKIIFDAQTD